MNFAQSSEGVPPTEAQPGSIEHVVPASLLWLHATHPSNLTPKTLANAGTTELLFRDQDLEARLVVARFIKKNERGKHVGGRRMYDEIMLPGVNTREDFNFEWDAAGKLVEYTEGVDMSDFLAQAMDTLEELSHQDGATVQVRGDYVERPFTGDGLRWPGHRAVADLASFVLQLGLDTSRLIPPTAGG